MKIRTILASASPRRRELIKYIDENIEIIPSNIDEKVYAKIMPKSIPEHLALKKAFDIAEKNKGALASSFARYPFYKIFLNFSMFFFICRIRIL